MANGTCSVPGCGKTGKLRRGLCGMHHERWRKTGAVGTASPSFIRGDDKARFLSKLDKNGPVPEHRPELGPCWIFTGYVNADGYGQIGISGEIRPAHLWAYEHFVGPVPKGKQLDHLCRTPACANYERHLEPVTPRENVLRGASTKLTDEDVLRAWILSELGVTKTALAKEMNVTVQAVSQRIKRLVARMSIP